MKSSVQLYAIRALAGRDLEKAIAAAAAIGYQAVEFAGFFDHSAEEVAEWLKKYNVEASGAHVDFKLITEQPDETIAFHKIIGNKNIICPGVWRETPEEFIEDIKKFADVVPKFKAAGMTLGYHNHSHEFQKYNGKYLIDIIGETLPDMTFEFDAYWVYRGGEDAAEYMKKYENRVNLFHAKDGKGEIGTTLGEGDVDLKAVFKFAKEHNFSYAVVESEANEEEDAQIQSITDDYAALIEFMK